MLGLQAAQRVDHGLLAAQAGAGFVGAESAGKHLFCEFPGERFVHVHLGLIGKFDIHPGPALAPVGQVRLRFQNDAGYAAGTDDDQANGVHPPV